jgi:hypothetical protein
MVRSPKSSHLPRDAEGSSDVPERGSKAVKPGDIDDQAVAEVCRRKRSVVVRKGQKKGNIPEPD